MGNISALSNQDLERSSNLQHYVDIQLASTIPPAYEITPEIQEILDLVESSEGQIIFVTGAAGTGKSTLIDILRSKIDKSMVVVAPTAVAALNSGGQTIHSFFHLAPRPQPQPKKIYGINGLALKNMEVLIIDEVSMVRADVMDAIATSLRMNTGNHLTPFAGKTVILIGDLHQLPPVLAIKEERRYLFKERYRTPYFFSADALQEVELTTRFLTRTFRHKDRSTVDILNKIRVGEDLQCTISALNNVCNGSVKKSEPNFVLTPTNFAADEINRLKLSEIDESKCIFEGKLTGHWGNPSSWLPAPRILELKTDAQVMFVKNSSKWINGTLGRVVEIGEQSVKVMIEKGPHSGEVEVRPEIWERLKYVWDPGQKKISTTPVGTYTQLPLRLAWATTIHKAQGLTLDNVSINFGKGAFERGQAYVALSRCKTMDGISLSRPIQVSDIKVDDKIIDFYDRLEVY